MPSSSRLLHYCVLILLHSYARNVRRKRTIYDNAAQSFAQTIRPNAEVAALIRSARKEITDSISTQNVGTRGLDMGIYVGVHIRRGDRKAEAWPHRGQYVPIADFVTAVNEAWARLRPKSILSTSQPKPVVWVASDSPEAQEEFLNAETNSGSTQEILAFSIARSKDDDLRALASQREYVHSEFVTYSLEERVNATKGALIDFAMLNGAWVWDDEARPMASVCTLRCVLSIYNFWLNEELICWQLEFLQTCRRRFGMGSRIWVLRGRGRGDRACGGVPERDRQ